MCAEISLVGDKDMVRWQIGWRGRAGLDDNNHQVRVLGSGPRAPDAFRFDRIGRLAQAGGVDQCHRHAAQHDACLQRVACGPREVGDNRNITFRQSIDKRRLADIRRPADGEEQTLSQLLATPGIIQVGSDFATDSRHRRHKFSLDLGRQILVGEIDQRLLVRENGP